MRLSTTGLSSLFPLSLTSVGQHIGLSGRLGRHKLGRVIALCPMTTLRGWRIIWFGRGVQEAQSVQRVRFYIILPMTKTACDDRGSYLWRQPSSRRLKQDLRPKDDRCGQDDAEREKRSLPLAQRRQVPGACTA